MSTTANNAGLDALNAMESSVATASPDHAIPPSTDGREALQALLAFSALHEQVRQRRAYERNNGGQADSAEVWRLEHFVLDEVLQLVAERARTMTGADGVALALAENEAIICRGSTGRIAPDIGARLDPNSGFSGACLSSGQIVRCDDSESDLRVDPFACRNLGTRSMVAVPLLAKGTVVGIIEAFSSKPYGFTDDDVRSLSLLAELILAALQPEEEDRLAEISQRVVGPRNGMGSDRATENIEPPVAAADKDELDQLVAGEAANAPLSDSLSQYQALEKARPGLGMVLALVLFAGILGIGLWVGIHRHARTVAGQRTAVSPAAAPAAAVTSAALPPPDSDSLSDEKSSLPPPSTDTSGAQPEVTGIRHWSSPDSSTVVIDLQDQVQYEAHRLANPERIYFDLFDTRLADALSGKKIEIGDALLERVRVAQPVRGVTRVVLETKGNSNFSVSLETNPYRLVVELRRIGSPAAERRKIDLFGPAGRADETASVEPSPVLPRLRIVLDPGHGGWDLGTVGREGLLEKDLTLDIVRRLGKLTESRLGAEVIFTRIDDDYVPLEKRAEIANLAKADLFISVHANYSDSSSARGVETYYTNSYSSAKARSPEDESDPEVQNVDWTHVDIREKVRGSHRFAADVQHALYGALAVKNPGLPNRGVKEAQYVVLTGTTMPAVLAEVSFVSSPTDENNLRNAAYRQQIAEALYQGISRYAQDSSKTKLASAVVKSVSP